jgi:gamma-glutamyltranspeptidase/glutathione hydrolase
VRSSASPTRRGPEKIASTTGEAFFAKPAEGRCTPGERRRYGDIRRARERPGGHDQPDHRVHDSRSAHGQGIVCLAALGIPSNHVADHGHSADTLHLQIEAVKLAFADAYRFVGDPRAMQLTPKQLLDPDYLASRARLIDMKRAQDFGHGSPPRSGTVYLTAADANGMMVSMIQSNFMGFGSGVVVSAPIICRTGVRALSHTGHPNQVAPRSARSRPSSEFVTRNGKPS